jgi:hypothetical protein
MFMPIIPQRQKDHEFKFSLGKLAAQNSSIRTKGVGSIAQVIEHLYKSMYEALGSIPNTTKKNFFSQDMY